MRSWLTLATLLFASCGGDDGGPVDSPDTTEGTWQLLAQQRPSSLLAAWAANLQDVWIVGGREGVGNGPSVFHFDGTAWTKLDTGERNIDIWSVFGFAGGDVFLGGTNGTILRYRNNAFEKLTTPSADIVFGMWGASSDDVWAVGGQTNGSPFVWRLQGNAFEEVPGVPAELDTSGAVWKVSGNSATDVWMSSSRGLMLHWDGTTLTNERIGSTDESLFGMGCHAGVCIAAGGNTTNGVLYENAGATWESRVPTLDGPVWRGMTPVGEHRYVVGMFGAVVRRANDTWVTDPHGLTSEALHAAWSDADGNLFAVGGKFDRALTIDGVLLYKGTSQLPALP